MLHCRLRRRTSGFTLIELLIVMAIILVIAAIAVPQMGKQLMAAHETAVISQIKTLQQMELQYYSQFGNWATSLAQLGPPVSGSAGPAAADLIPASLASGHMSGYVFNVAASPTGYAITAVPETFGNSGSRTFYSDQTGVIRNNFTQEPATVNSPAIGTPVAGTSPAAAPAAK